MQRSLQLYVLVAVFGSLALFVVPLDNGATGQNSPSAPANQPVKIQAGAGNSSLLLTQFIPKVVQVKIGENVTWYNPSTVPVAHTVTFVRDSNSTVTGILFPFNVPNSAQFVPIPASGNGEPYLVTGANQSKTLLAANARAINSIVIDSLGDITYLDANSHFNVDGTEKYVNSGAIFPVGKILPNYKSETSFTLSFQKAGTYDYSCMFHPWMKGIVIVK
jgi:plastocyanin